MNGTALDDTTANAIDRAAQGSAIDSERSAAQADQTAADADQTASDADQTASDRDEADALSDQRVVAGPALAHWTRSLKQDRSGRGTPLSG